MKLNMELTGYYSFNLEVGRYTFKLWYLNNSNSLIEFCIDGKSVYKEDKWGYREYSIDRVLSFMECITFYATEGKEVVLLDKGSWYKFVTHKVKTVPGINGLYVSMNGNEYYSAPILRKRFLNIEPTVDDISKDGYILSKNEIDSRATPEEREKILLKCGFKLDEDFELIVNSKYGYLVDNNDDEGISISSTDSLGEVFIPNQQINLVEDTIKFKINKCEQVIGNDKIEEYPVDLPHSLRNKLKEDLISNGFERVTESSRDSYKSIVSFKKGKLEVKFNPKGVEVTDGKVKIFCSIKYIKCKGNNLYLYAANTQMKIKI